jgi:hypothetical protein
LATNYNIPARNAAINEIRRRIIDRNESSAKIIEDLRLSERTFRRYRTAALKPIIKRLADMNQEQVKEQAVILIARIDGSLERMTALATDKELDPRQRDSQIAAEDSVLQLIAFLLEIEKEAIDKLPSSPPPSAVLPKVEYSSSDMEVSARIAEQKDTQTCL